MPRVIGVEIPDNKRLEIALTYIFGVGRTTSLKVCKDLGLDPGVIRFGSNGSTDVAPEVGR